MERSTGGILQWIPYIQSLWNVLLTYITPDAPLMDVPARLHLHVYLR